MKAPEPAIPKGAPEGTLWYGGSIDWLRITLRITGDDLDPDEVSRAMGCSPDMSHRKGEPILRRDGTVARVARFGTWHLQLTPEDTDEWDCGEAMMLLMARLPFDVGVWSRVTRKFKADLFVSLSMSSRNKGFSLSPEVMRFLGERGVETGFDIYCNAETEAEQVDPHEPPPAASVP